MMTYRVNIRRERACRRRASTYLFFLGTSLAVAVIGVSALMAVRVQRKNMEGLNDLAVARMLARSAVEHGFTKINADAGWRTNLGSGVWETNKAFGGGTFSIDAFFIDDGDGNPANDNVILTGTGARGTLEYKIEVTLIAQGSEVAIAPGSWKRKIE